MVCAEVQLLPPVEVDVVQPVQEAEGSDGRISEWDRSEGGRVQPVWSVDDDFGGRGGGEGKGDG